MKNSTPKRQLPKLQLLSFLAKFLSNQDFNLCEEETSAHSNKVIKSINSQTSNTSAGNDGLKVVLYKCFSNERAPVLLDVYGSWGRTWYHKCYF